MTQVVRHLRRHTHPNLLVGFDTLDDAGVFRLEDDLALVQTVDFFPPLVDDPYDFGRIAAANALSDVYAMGGEPLTALNIVAFPDQELDLDLLAAILNGGADVVAQAGAVVVGGHSIRDAEVKYGLAVTGRVHPSRILTNAGARPGDRLVLTKPLGSGVLTTAVKNGKLAPEALTEAVGVMTALNKPGRDAAVRIGITSAAPGAGPLPAHDAGHEVPRSKVALAERANAAARSGVNLGAPPTPHDGINAGTDVTGFGLVGHAFEMAEAADVSITLFAGRVPLMAHVLELARQGVLTRAHKATREHLADRLVVEPQVEPALAGVLLDAQTSGGLLLSVSPSRCDDLIRELHAAGALCADVVGQVGLPQRVRVRVTV